MVKRQIKQVGNKEKIIKYLNVLKKKGVNYKGIADQTGIKEGRIRNISKGLIDKIQDSEIESIEREYWYFLQNGSSTFFLPPEIQKRIDELESKAIDREHLEYILELIKDLKQEGADRNRRMEKIETDLKEILKIFKEHFR